MDVGKALKVISERNSVSQADICRATGISDAYISQLFGSKIVNPRFDRVCEIADVLHVSLDEVGKLAKSLPDPVRE